MSFDTEIRNKLARMVGDARQLLRIEFQEQLQELYGIQPNGKIISIEKLTHLNDEQLAIAALLRQGIEYLKSSYDHENNPIQAAIEQFLHEQSFTILNRFAALRICEERGIIQECLRSGTQSKGFQVYLQIAGSGIGDRSQRYKTFLLCIFAEIAVDLGILFDRFSKEGVLFPREKALTQLLEIINEKSLINIWNEDETIGWIYQYFNSREEREAMRKASGIPRNSRELAVRNQFFTPRYIVKFLTDNTLGRIWYEMHQGKTSLVETCEYMIRWPNEIFLQDSEIPPKNDNTTENLPQEQLIKKPAYIPFRSRKDPREIKILDPACGSAHFLLYAFDVLKTIYEEAWDDLELSESIQKDYESIDDYRKAIPSLILKHNLYGIDIDARCAQIGSLSLWLRAQRAYRELNLSPAKQPRITKTNIVTAEPMPGKEEMLEEFAKRFPSKAIGQMVTNIFGKMKLAGEAGSLLRIEEEVRSEVSRAKALWKKGPKFEQIKLFMEAEEKPDQGELLFDFSGITDDKFWQKAEEQIYTILYDYTEKFEIYSYKRRLFADNVGRGFAFIELCRKKYDVVLMNPPFGDTTLSSFNYVAKNFSFWNKNLLCAFLARGWELINETGVLAAIYDRTAIIKSTYEDFRKHLIVSEDHLFAVADLGWDVLESNVEATSSVFKRNYAGYASFFDVRAENHDIKEMKIIEYTQRFNSGYLSPYVFIDKGSNFSSMPNAALSYDMPHFIKRMFNKLAPLLKSGAFAVVGHQFKSDWHMRCWWEVPAEAYYPEGPWWRMYNGSSYGRYYIPLVEIVLWGNEGELVRDHPSVYLRNHHYQNKIAAGYGKRGDFVDAHLIPAGFFFTNEGQGIVPEDKDSVWYYLGLANSNLFNFILNHYCGQHKQSGYVNLVPVQSYSKNKYIRNISNLTKKIVLLKICFDKGNELSPLFFSAITRISMFDRRTFNEVNETMNKFINELDLLHNNIQEQVEDLYALLDEEKKYVRRKTIGCPEDQIVFFGAEPYNFSPNLDLSASLISYALGICYGRWDIRCSTGEKNQLDISNPFDPLPNCPPGMLQNSTGLPASSKDVPSEYPIQIHWNGILVDDPNHQGDIVNQVSESLNIICKNSFNVIEQDIYKILNIKSLREYFQNPNKFFFDHLKRYSKGRRRAPIYWPISTKSGSYTLWLYYSRLNNQTLFTCITDFVDPKLDEVSKDINRLGKEIKVGRDSKKGIELERLQNLRHEINLLRNELLHITKLSYEPNLNDGVIITACPLWKLFQHRQWQNELKKCWEKLKSGEYDWAHLAYSIWPERVKEKCKSDKSLAIAHGLEDLYKGS